jgi:hypothetical protein
LADLDPQKPFITGSEHLRQAEGIHYAGGGHWFSENLELYQIWHGQYVSGASMSTWVRNTSGGERIKAPGEDENPKITI